MSEDRVDELRHPGSFSEDPLTAVLRPAAQRRLTRAVEMEVTAFIAIARFKQTSGRSRCAAPGCVTAGCGRSRQNPFHLGDDVVGHQPGIGQLHHEDAK